MMVIFLPHSDIGFFLARKFALPPPNNRKLGDYVVDIFLPHSDIGVLFS
jgi:hypothetical protein